MTNEDEKKKNTKLVIIQGKELNIDMDEVSKDLDVIGLKLAETRSEAIDGRKASGIEDEWLEDEEYYEGVDDANRSELKAWRGKPLGSKVIEDQDNATRGSTIFLNITRAYVDAVSARMGDMMLPIADKSWAISPTPKPEMSGLADGKIPRAIRESIDKNNEDPEARAAQEKNAVEQAKELMKFAKEAAKKAETQIWDWHVESQFNSHNRRLIEDSAKVGSGILKGPIPVKSTKLVFVDGKLKQVDEVKPASIRIFYRNFYPDPACGEDIHSGSYTWERDDITPAGLMKLIGTPGYLTPQIKKVIEQGPMMAEGDYTAENPGLSSYATDKRKNLFEIWYYHGAISTKDLLAIDIMSEKENIKFSNDEEFVYVQLTMVNNHVIKTTISHLENGEFPYDVMVWQRRLGMPFGIGVARQLRPAQRIIVGAMRHMMDNAGVAGGPMLYIDTNLVQAAEGPNEVRPWKVFIGADEADSDTPRAAKDAIQFLKAPMIQEELQNIIELGLKLAEDITGLPLIMQGQTNAATPETLGGMMLQNYNASSVLRRVARLYDDIVTTPHIRRYYKHILQHSKDDSLKGDFNIDARGSSALIEKDAANQALLQIGAYVNNPIFGKDPKKWLDKVLKAYHIDPETLNFDDEQWQEIVEKMAQPQADPKLEIEQLRQQTAMSLAEFKAEREAEVKQFDAQVKGAVQDKQMEFEAFKTQLKDASDDKERQFKVGFNQMNQEFAAALAQLTEEGVNARQVEVLKQKIQDTVLKLQTQVSLNDTDVATPVAEPKGRAPDGEAFKK
tara:strand:+ start:3207 stop:5567 length:2361 start_codon:yes stop_codon:yes gene_type:complete